jgi:glycosyltransferase involved in cell wall biosynthesis
VVGLDASRAFAERPTGTERYSAEVLRRLVARGRFRYRLYCRDEAPEPPAGADLRRFGPRRLWTHLGLGPELRRSPPDLVFVPAHVLPLGRHPPAVVTVHDLGYRRYPAAHTRRQRAYLEWSTRRHARRATRLIADSVATASDLARDYGADPARIRVVPLGVAESLAPAPPPAVAAARAWAGLPAGARYFLHVGTRQPRKNLGRLVRAFAPLAVAHPDLVLVLAGDYGWGPDEAVLAAAALGLGHRVRVLGYAPEDQLAGLYSGAEALLLPSLYEGFGLTALEAMACGTAVLASTAGSLPEVVGSAALGFDPLDEEALAGALARLLDEPALAAALVEAGLERAAAFTWERTAAATEAVLAEALGEDLVESPVESLGAA